ncbi:PREDICTED: integral membrane protein GPR155-like isoform X2 [Amphimedon queenslandica]|uniref:G-protein coupled receptors family 2 profile 2 domain-containing protein n=1 Tax=Amphimedon queenslandica TaxID=400682 RepID=A0AAN0IL85_AMPQE|nr:PREDICTED: integral membrane protein GPR155-like isoform X2 [Amphimedon queenslandica]|eukprot:XP_011402850.1 PREDICTED: integral membrane protein GPR155-like isoform X2 [Amphimedon queenslandica]
MNILVIDLLGKATPSSKLLAMAVSFFSAIAQSFAVILLGYLFGRFKLIDPREARSITTLVGKLALPALLFRNLAILDLSQVSWAFLGSILTAKFIVFVLVVGLSLAITRKIGRSGLYGIFATQSNDFALGLPIVEALYSKDDPGGFNFSSYLYLFAPISLAIINPIGFFMLEYSKQSTRSRLTCKRIPVIVGKTFFYLLINPIMFMTLLGLVVNVIISYWSHTSFPGWLDSFLTLVGGAYAPCALFNIGLFMVGKLGKVTGYTIFVSTLLIIAKSIILPLIGYVTVDLFLRAEVDDNSTLNSIASFGFLYCTFPTAPTVFIYASQYSTVVPIIASSIVFGTLVSAPLMYVTARMVTVRWAEESSYEHTLYVTRLNASSIAILCLIWVFILFILSKRYKSYTHTIVMHLMFAQLLECMGSIALDQLATKGVYWDYVLFAIFFIGVFSSRLWLICLCIGLIVLIKKGLSIAKKIWWPMFITAWGVPVFATVLLEACSKPQNKMSTSFMFGLPQLVISVAFLLSAFIAGLVLVIIIIINVNKNQEQWNTDTQDANERTYLLSSGRNGTNNNHSVSVSTNNNEGERESEILISTKSSSPADSEVSSRFYSYTFENTGTQERDESGKSLTPFLVLAIFLIFSCLVGILVVFWQLVDSSISGVFVAAVVLDNVTNFGQGFFVFIVFGFEKHWFWLKAYSRLRGCFFKVEVVELPEENELTVAQMTLCNIFKNNYLQKCKDDIVSDKSELNDQS